MCQEVRVVFDIHDIEMKKTKGIISRLKVLDLDELPNLTCIWNKNPQGIVSFPYLQEVRVNDCGCMTALFPSPLVRNLIKLQKLKILRCGELVEIVGKEDAATELGTTEMFHFPYLSVFFLYKLSKLSCFYPGKHHLECPILETLDVSYCPMLKLFTSEFSDKEPVRESEVSAPNTISQLRQPLFSVEKVVPKLKQLTLNEENIILLSDGHGPPHLLCNLDKLDLSFEDHDRKKDTLPFDLLLKVPSLQHLAVRRCCGLKEIFPTQQLEVHDGKLPELKRLTLVKHRQLESIGLENPWVKPFSVTLKKLTVRFCKRIHYLFTFSTAESLVHLEFLDVQKCKLIREIVKKEDEDASAEIKFGRLTTLELDSLPKLASFYSGKATLQFSRLKTFTVADCRNMKTFSEGSINAPMFQGIETSTEDYDLTFHNDLNSTVQSLFVTQEDPEMEEFRYGKAALQDNYSQSLKKLVLKNITNNFKISSKILRVLRSLEDLQVVSCKALQVIFDIDKIETMEKNGIVSPLKKLSLDELPNLKRVWSKNPQGIIKFPNLQEVRVNDCRRLATLFHSSLAKNLIKLGTLYIQNCAKLVSIVRKEDEMEQEATAMLEFPSLSSLLLYKLRRLSCFYPGKHCLECSILESLDVSYCPELKLFDIDIEEITESEVSSSDATDSEVSSSDATDSEVSSSDATDSEVNSSDATDSEVSSSDATDSEVSSSDATDSEVSSQDSTESEVSSPDTISQLQQPLFSVEKVVPKLKKLTLNEKNIMLMKKKDLPQDLLGKLNYLELCFEDDHNEEDTLPFDFLHKVHNLEHLVVRCLGIKEIFPAEKLQVRERIPTTLKMLTLDNLKELESIGLEHQPVKPYSEKLEILNLQSCPQLQNVVPNSVSFISLKQLSVKLCQRMKYLFKFSTAKSLVQLESLIVKNCKSIKEIAKKEDEDNDDEITFGQLTTLRLDSLPGLVGFYLGKAGLQFPCLKEVNIAKCPKMKKFSRGVAKAPMFPKINLAK